VRLLLISPEIAPLAKTGGLADVVAGLSQALAALDVEVRLVMPAYTEVLKAAPRPTPLELNVPSGNGRVRARILETRLKKVPVFLIQADSYFLRDGLYGTSSQDFSDNAERFAFFSKAALRLAERTGPWDVLHCNDWQSALIPLYQKLKPSPAGALGHPKVLLTIHNLAYQGVFPESQWKFLNLDKGEFFNSAFLEYYGQINFLKGGIVSADAVTTVSRRYAREILTPDYGCGLEGVLRQRQEHLTGILNGVDYEEWNPEMDPHIARNYSAIERSGKETCKEDLQKAFCLPRRSSVPLLGVVARLVDQKGVDLLLKTADAMAGLELQLVILGTGPEPYESALAAMASRWGNVAVKIGFDNVLAHRIEAGADLFLMPSRYEPCGLNQIYSLKYGTIPIVRATGGLDDTIEDFDPRTGSGNGFKFIEYTGQALLEALRRALVVYRRKAAWEQLVTNAMGCDFSWAGSAREYRALYGKLAGG